MGVNGFGKGFAAVAQRGRSTLRTMPAKDWVILGKAEKAVGVRRLWSL